MAELYPYFETPEVFTPEHRQGIKFGKSYFFDFKKGEFVTEGNGKIREASEHEAWVEWCLKAVLTKRLAFLAYSHNFGIDLDDVNNQVTRSGKEAELERVITEALLADPRTEIVSDFQHDWQNDELKTSFLVKPVIGKSERLEVNLDE